MLLADSVVLLSEFCSVSGCNVAMEVILSLKLGYVVDKATWSTRLRGRLCGKCELPLRAVRTFLNRKSCQEMRRLQCLAKDKILPNYNIAGFKAFWNPLSSRRQVCFFSLVNYVQHSNKQCKVTRCRLSSNISCPRALLTPCPTLLQNKTTVIHMKPTGHINGRPISHSGAAAGSASIDR